MTLVERIKAEIDRRFIEYNKDANHHLQAAALADLSLWIDKLEYESVETDDELNKEITNSIRELNGVHKLDNGKVWWTGSYETLKQFALHIAAYQKELIIEKSIFLKNE